MSISKMWLWLMASMIVFGSFCTAQTSDDPVVASVGDIEIRQSDLDRKIQEAPPVVRSSFETVEGQLKLLDRIIRTKAMMKAAEDAGFNDRPEIQAQFRDQRERILAYEYFQETISPGPMPSESDLIDYYERVKDEKYQIEATAEVQQIVVGSKEFADRVKSQIESGETTFDKAVELHSEDESKKNNGYLGPINESSYIAGIGRSQPFMDAVFGMKANQISDPIQTRRGWHIIRLITLRNAGHQPYETVRKEIAKEFLVTPEDIRKEYTQNADKYKAREQCRISHILVDTKEEADNVLAELKRGKDFEYLVKTYSKDVSSINQNGDLGFLFRGGYVKGVGKDVEFENVVLSLSLGEISAPIQSRKGWHVVRVDEKQEATVKPLVEVESQIRQALIEKKIDEFQEARFNELNKRYQTKIYTDRIKAK